MSDIEAQLRRAITTASNDDMSEPKTEKRERHVQRLTAMTEAIDELAALRSLTAELVEALEPFAAWAEAFAAEVSTLHADADPLHKALLLGPDLAPLTIGDMRRAAAASARAKGDT